MTSSEKPESSDPQQDAGRSSASTQTVDDKVSTTDSEAAASANGTEESGSTAGDGGGEALDGTDSPPPWQRGSASSEDSSSEDEQDSGSLSGSLAAGALGGAAAGGATDSAAGSRETDDTQTIPKTVSDQETVRTQIPQSARTQVSYTGAGAAAGSGSGSAASRSASGTSARRPSRGPRRASLQIKRFDPWSVLKLALVLSVALFFVWMIAVAVLYGVLDGMGVWEQLNGTFTELTQPDDAVNEPLISAGRVFGVASIIGAINIVLITALATVAAFIYNVAADFAGGIEITLSERE
ncbi:DUF3566 domain-containing protein [Saccharopolyspora dendranthemae]|uniref:Transmembrane protein DUF3566 n=1 Tax=Saccharopolyspora dendranthemae TaxID=1181886 RepID=A0A561U5D6_9PSEU|nr:DUF3566 domain-containing protein [Saccharopolyspora dendranthemae]TWF94579.1 transmembrane protein DUF3566 [Saccharopolyspora dendranthemae]